jgi:hypothetical protein
MSSELTTGTAAPAQAQTTERGRARSVATWAAVIGGIGWISKILIMWAQGGPDTESIPEALAFFTGLIGISVAGAAAAWVLASDAGKYLRILAVVVGFLVPMVVVGIYQTALGALLPDAGWFRDESIFLILGIIALALGARELLARRS